MVIIKKVGALSLAKLETVVMAIFGLIVGIFYAVFSSLLNSTSTEYSTGISLTLGWWGIIVFPIFYGVLGFVTGIIGAWLYNLVSRWVGGIELEFKK